MTKKIKNILRGAGSVMEIAPTTNYNQFVPEKNIAKRIEGHWTRTGKNIQKAIDCFSNDQTTKK